MTATAHTATRLGVSSAPGSVSRSRSGGFLILIGLLGLFAGFLLFGLPLTVIGWFESSDSKRERERLLQWAQAEDAERVEDAWALANAREAIREEPW